MSVIGVGAAEKPQKSEMVGRDAYPGCNDNNHARFHGYRSRPLPYHFPVNRRVNLYGY